MYNGFPATDVTVNGAKNLGIENVRDKMVGRGVLLDIARWKGVDSLDDGYPITNDDLDGCAAAPFYRAAANSPAKSTRGKTSSLPPTVALTMLTPR